MMYCSQKKKSFDWKVLHPIEEGQAVEFLVEFELERKWALSLHWGFAPAVQGLGVVAVSYGICCPLWVT